MKRLVALSEKSINTAENYDIMKHFLSPDLDSVYSGGFGGSRVQTRPKPSEF